MNDKLFYLTLGICGSGLLTLIVTAFIAITIRSTELAEYGIIAGLLIMGAGLLVGLASDIFSVVEKRKFFWRQLKK